MAEHGSAISLSHTSDEESSEHTSRRFVTISGVISGSAGGYPSPSNTNAIHNKLPPPPPNDIIDVEQQRQHMMFSASKRPRGRPPGAKNKPKPPLVIHRDSEQALKPVVIEISAGSDVVETLVHFARRRHVGISVLSASGSVSNVTLRHPVSRAPAFPFNGPFTLLSLSGTYISCPFLPPSSSSSSPSLSPAPPPPTAAMISSWPPCSSFGICLAGSRGQVFGGVVGGQVLAASLVVVVVSVFKKPEFCRVPEPMVNAANIVETQRDKYNPCAGGGGDASDQSGYTNNNNHMSISRFNVAGSSAQLPSDVNVMQWSHFTS